MSVPPRPATTAATDETFITVKGRGGADIKIRADFIVAILGPEGDNPNHTKIYVMHQHVGTFLVMETPDEIERKVREARALTLR